MTENKVEPPIQFRHSQDGHSTIRLPDTRVDQVREALEKHAVPFWVDSHSISVEGKPFMSRIYLGYAADLDLVRELLEEIG